MDGAARDAASPAGDGRVDAAYPGGESYAFAARGHTALTDQPASNGGADAAPTPTELLVAALATCVAFYAGRYLTRHGLDRDGLRVTAEFTMAADRPARVGAIRLRGSPCPQASRPGAARLSSPSCRTALRYNSVSLRILQSDVVLFKPQYERTRLGVNEESVVQAFRGSHDLPEILELLSRHLYVQRKRLTFILRAFLPRPPDLFYRHFPHYLLSTPAVSASPLACAAAFATSILTISGSIILASIPTDIAPLYARIIRTSALYGVGMPISMLMR